MRNRILALALAGTTAFSVFGSTIANAATVITGCSTHTGSGDGAYYESYLPAGTIHWSTKEVAATAINVARETWAPVEYKQDDVVAKGEKLYTTQAIYDGMSSAAVKNAVTVLKEGDGIYFADIAQFADKNGYITYTCDGGGVVDIDGVGKFQLVTEDATGKTFIFPESTWNSMVQTGYTKIAAEGSFYSDVKVTDSRQVFTEDEILARYVSSSTPFYFIGDTQETNLHNIPANTVKVAQKDAYDANVVFTDRGYDTLNTVDIEDVDAVLEEKVENGVVYLYDYFYDSTFPSSVSPERFAKGWADETLAEILDDASGNPGSGSINPETGYNYRSVRQDVLYTWYDFLDTLGIADASEDHLVDWAEKLLENYAYTYRDASIIADVKPVEGGWEITFGGSVNLYNFDQLVEDILELAPKGAAEDVQTSELIYLMQQYDKYVGDGFVDVKPVEQGDWGQLLAALAEAPTEEEFRSSAAYKHYTRRVEDLVDDYEDAGSAIELSMAEEALYNFVTSYSSTYAASSEKADKSGLASAIDSAYFNADWAKIGEVYAGQDTNGILDGHRVNSDYSYAWALFPKNDFKGSVSGKNAGVSTAIQDVTEEYFWFYNVYDLAYNVYANNRYQSALDLMAESLTEAIDALAPTEDAYGSTILAAEEQADRMADTVETDYTSSMWANREKIFSFIDGSVSAGKAGDQASKNAAAIAKETVTLMGFQKNQTVVTRGEINQVKDAKASAEKALKDLREDQDRYNAAQANALQSAIDACDKIIDLFNGNYSTSKLSQSVNGSYSAATGDKDQILKSDITEALENVESAIDFSNVIQGWSKNEDGKWQYGTEEGYLNDGWEKIGKTWFYFNEDGTAKQSEWMKENGKWYWFNANCGAAIGWAKVDGNWYYFKGDNAMKTGWEKVDGSWYYMTASGRMVTGWCQVNGVWYYFSKESNALGQMLANTTTPDGYKVDANGALID